MTAAETVGVILCGGRSSRLGGCDKPLLSLGAGTILDAIVHRLKPQLRQVAISAGGDPGRFSPWPVPVLPDPIPGQAGPLAGIQAGLDWASGCGAPALLSAAGDGPFLPHDLVARLADAVTAKDVIAVASSAGRRHPVFALWPVALRHDLRNFLDSGAKARVSDFIDRHRSVEVAFDPVPGLAIDPFFNINTPADLSEASRIAAGIPV